METQTHTTTVAAVPSARLGSTHGYRFAGDTVFLNSAFTALPGSAREHGWALQLLALARSPESAAELASAHLIAEAPLPPLSELTGAVDNYEVAAAAVPPSGRGEHTLVLALVSRDAAGTVEFHDHAAYRHTETFLQPRIEGAAGYWIEGNAVVLDVDAIANPRSADNLSGELSLELWALSAPYSGGSFQGQPVAGALLGRLAGGDTWTPAPIHLPATLPTGGTAHFVLLLREWTGHGYTTRDHVTFATPYVAPVAETLPPVPASPIPESAPAVQPAPAPVAAVIPVPAPAPVVSLPTPAAAPISPKPVARKPVDPRLSVNQATKAELLAIKGVSTAVAAEIVKRRPFATLEDLRGVKGVGPKSFEKLKAFLKL